MIPLRMCMVCRKRAEKQALIRISHSKDGKTAVDPENQNGGRGAYICRNSVCIGQAQKRKVLERAFASPIDERIYEELIRIAGDADE